MYDRGVAGGVGGLNKKFFGELLHLSSVAQPCLTICDPLDCSAAGLPVHRQLMTGSLFPLTALPDSLSDYTNSLGRFASCVHHP